jgi:hypothetical protein
MQWEAPLLRAATGETMTMQSPDCREKKKERGGKKEGNITPINQYPAT